MALPFVSRALYDQALAQKDQQIADLKEANAKLWELVSAKQEVAAKAEEEDEPQPPRPIRKLGSQLRTEFAQAAAERAKGMNK